MEDAPSEETERCNGLDDDDDGQIDEGNPGGENPCDTGAGGACAEGRTRCRDGLIVCEPTAIPGTIDECDGQDDDCDGVVDEDAACVIGDVCVTDGECNTSLDGSRCGPGGFGPAAAADDTCDATNEDCDWWLDEDCEAWCFEIGCPLPDDTCAAPGECHPTVAGAVCARPDERPPIPDWYLAAPEICSNGGDDDCDAEVDELDCACGSSSECPVGDGTCVGGCHPSILGLVCLDGSWTDATDPDLCDETDDDCDDEVDEDCPCEATECPVDESGKTCAPEGTCYPAIMSYHTCVGGDWVFSADWPDPCDGRDDDCGGDIDEDCFGDCPMGCALADGACADMVSCYPGVAGVQCTAVGWVAAGAETCGNGLDDDCDGVVDEADCT